jgi:restriction endonuclease S subunit
MIVNTPLNKIANIKFGQKINNKLNNTNFEQGLNILITLAGNINVKFINQKIYLTTYQCILKIDDEYIKKFVGYYLISNIHLLLNLCNGSVIDRISKQDISNFNIPLPESKDIIIEWVNKISYQYNIKTNLKFRLNILFDFIKNKMQNINDFEEFDFEHILTFVPIKNKHKISDGSRIGPYKFYIPSQKNILYRDSYDFEDIHIIIGNIGRTAIHFGSKFSVSNNVYVIKSKDNNLLLLKYIYYYLKLNIELLSNTFNNSIVRFSRKNELSKIKIKIPKNKNIIDHFHTLFLEIESLESSIKEAKNIYDQFINELSDFINQNIEEQNIINELCYTLLVDEPASNHPSGEVVATCCLGSEVAATILKKIKL